MGSSVCPVRSATVRIGTRASYADWRMWVSGHASGKSLVRAFWDGLRKPLAWVRSSENVRGGAAPEGCHRPVKHGIRGNHAFRPPLLRDPLPPTLMPLGAPTHLMRGSNPLGGGHFAGSGVRRNRIANVARQSRN